MLWLTSHHIAKGINSMAIREAVVIEKAWKESNDSRETGTSDLLVTVTSSEVLFHDLEDVDGVHLRMSREDFKSITALAMRVTHITAEDAAEDTAEKAKQPK